MSSIFDSISVAAKAAQNAVYGEAFTVLPTRANGDANRRARIADPERASFSAQGRYYQATDSSAQLAPDRRALVTGERGLHARSPETVTLDNPPCALRSNDMIRRERNGQWYSINDVVPDGTGTFVLMLSRATDAPEA